MTGMTGTNLTNHLLIAMPQLQDPNFEKTVTLICEHNEEGALGLVINRPLAISVAEVLEQMDLEYHTANLNESVLMGGPVAHERGFILHKISNDPDEQSQPWSSSLNVSEQVCVTTSKDILEAISQGAGPEFKEFALGYSGWEAGQLEEELLSNAWLTVPGDLDIIFHTPYVDRWKASAQLIGLDLERLSGDIGHA
jgi:putative transcriptional regulator